MLKAEQLCQKALAMRQQAYCPYSHYAVGAALQGADDTIYTGCNIENAAYSATLCAERVALVKAVSEGARNFVRLAIAASGEDYCVPCGVCRQMLWEFAPDLEIICLNGQGQARIFSLRELLPHAFDSGQL